MYESVLTVEHRKQNVKVVNYTPSENDDVTIFDGVISTLHSQNTVDLRGPSVFTSKISPSVLQQTFIPFKRFIKNPFLLVVLFLYVIF